MASIFLSYRRSDSAGWAGRLHDSLRRVSPSSKLFMDIEDIPPGVDFERFIGAAVARCDLLIALIGPQWVDARDAAGRRRLDSADDFTRIEIESALKRDIRVIPVLVGGAHMPSSDQLPESMRSLARRQNFELSDRGWEEACRRLARAIEDAVAPSPAPPAAGGRPSAEPAVPLPEKPAATVSSGSPQRRWGMGIAATIVAALVLAIVLFLKSSAPANQPPTGDGGPDGPGPDPPKAAAPTLLDLGLEGRWRLEATGDSDAGRVLIERNGTTLRLAVIELGGARHDLGTATVEETVMQFDFADARLGALHAEASKSSPGDWAVRWSSSECSNADVTLATSTDLRIWKGHMKCFDARRSLTESVEFSASLASDRNTLTLTAQEDGGGKGATIVLRRE